MQRQWPTLCLIALLAASLPCSGWSASKTANPDATPAPSYSSTQSPAKTREQNEIEAAQVRKMHADLLGMYRRGYELVQQIHPEDTQSLAVMTKAINNLNAPVITDGLKSPNLVLDPVFRELVRKNLSYMKADIQPNLEKLEAMAKNFKQPIKPATPEDFKTP